MNKNASKGIRYAIQWETHPKNLLKNFCSLMEHQSLVDVVVCCGNNAIQAHKFVLAANSPLFREEFEKNPTIEQIIIGGCDFIILKSVVEMMYCGQTVVTEDNVKFLVALLKQFQMKHLENLFTEHAGASEGISLPKPQFVTKKPKYPAFTYQLPPSTPQNAFPPQFASVVTSVAQPPLSVPISGTQAQIAVNMANAPLTSVANILKPLDFNIGVPSEAMPGFKPYNRGKRTLKLQAEQACVKEAQASRMALASLQKEIAAAPQVNSFIIEDTCTETTVENFIPHTETSPYVPVLNYDDLVNESLGNSLFLPVSQSDNNQVYNSLINQQPPAPVLHQQSEEKPPTLTADKLKYMLGAQVPANVEIMYKDADGNFVPVNEEVLQNLSMKDGLQYQVVDEEGRVSEMQELQVIDKIGKIIDSAVRLPMSNADMVDINKPIMEVGDFLKDTQSSLAIKNGMCSIVSQTGAETTIPTPVDTTQAIMELPSLEATPRCISDVAGLKFSPDMFFADIISNGAHDATVVADDIFVETSDHKPPKLL